MAMTIFKHLVKNCDLWAYIYIFSFFLTFVLKNALLNWKLFATKMAKQNLWKFLKIDWKKINTPEEEQSIQTGGFPWCLSDKGSACQCRKLRFDSWFRKIPRGGNGNPLQYFCLGNPMDSRAWRATVHGAARESDKTSQLNNNNKY